MNLTAVITFGAMLISPLRHGIIGLGFGLLIFDTRSQSRISRGLFAQVLVKFLAPQAHIFQFSLMCHAVAN